MQTLAVTPEQRKTGYSAAAEGFRLVAAHKTGLLSIKIFVRINNKKKAAAEMAVVRTHLAGGLPRTSPALSCPQTPSMGAVGLKV